MLDTKALAAAMAPVIREAVDKAVSAAEAPLLRRIEALEKRAPEKGEPGPAGKDGVDGQDGAPGADGRDGVDGKDGVNGEPGAPGERGLDGKDGRDGVGVAGAVIDRSGQLVLTLSDGTTRDLGAVIGKDGRDGIDGKDGERGASGFGLEDFDTDWRPEDKILVLSWDAGETSYSHELFVPYLRDAGVWSEGATYLQGDCVTWGGSMWTAQEDTAEKPESGKAWRLAVKRGRDGKDFAGPQPKAIEKVRV